MKYLNKILILIPNLIVFAATIPISNLSHTTFNKWVVLKDDNLSENNVTRMIENPAEYLKSSPNTFQLDLGSQKDIPIQFYQLFENFNVNSSVAAITIVELADRESSGRSENLTANLPHSSPRRRPIASPISVPGCQ